MMSVTTGRSSRLAQPQAADASKSRLLYVCYLTLDDPLAHTQVVAYLAGLASAGHDVHLLTFEPGRLTRRRRRDWRDQMKALGIRWHGLRYHKSPSLAATIYDTLVGGLCIAIWSRQYRLDAVHARVHVPAAMALLARSFSRTPPALVFDIRGLMVEEYEEAGRWRPGGLPSRITRAVQNRAIQRADRIVVLTETARQKLFDSQRQSKVHVIPCCADLTQLDAGRQERRQIRKELGLEDSTVMIYVGKFPSWSMPDEMVRFFASAAKVIDRLHLLVLTQDDRTSILAQLDQFGVDPTCYTITSVPAPRVAGYLAAADFAITFIKPAPSTIGQSPTKLGEYLGAGLPVVYSAGIGDLDQLMSPAIAVRVTEHSPHSHQIAASAVLRLLSDPDTRARCRETAAQSLSLEQVGVPRYLAIYDALAR
jgi:glycosyltransferase involved in cell wall biosynthesis